MVEPKARPGLGLSARISRDHVGEILVVDAADLLQRRKLALGEKIEMSDQRLHGGIEAIALLELDRQALGEIARAHAGRIEGLHHFQHRLDLGKGRAELVGDVGEIAD